MTELTPEERGRIYQEEKARIEAREQIEQERREAAEREKQLHAERAAERRQQESVAAAKRKRERQAVTLFIVVAGFVVFMGIIDQVADSPSPPARPQSGVQGVAGTEERLSIPSDPSAQYFVLDRGGTTGTPTITTRRVGPSGTSYSQREYDCQARTVRYLGDGDTLQQMASSSPDPRMGAIVEGSIADDIRRAACRGL